MTVVVSGASRGIGLALVEQYLSGGSEVIAICRDPASAAGLDPLRASHSTLTVLRGDVSDPASTAEVATAIGDKPVDLLLNVAGIANWEFKPEDIDFGTWAASFDVMITGPFRMLVALLPNLERARGKIVSVSSQVGASDWAAGGFYSYGAAKAGLNRAMKSLAVDLHERGRRSSRIRQDRHGRPERRDQSRGKRARHQAGGGRSHPRCDWRLLQLERHDPRLVAPDWHHSRTSPENL